MVTENEEERITCLDLESTGISPRDGSRLIQVACIITDGNLKELDEGFEMKVYFSEDDTDELFDAADPFVQDMHIQNGLWRDLPRLGRTLQEVEESLLEYIKKHVPIPRTSVLCGNSITLDRNFLEAEMPSVLNHLHYRSYDMSSVAKHFSLAIGTPLFRKNKTHDALDDIRESIAEARYYKEILKELAFDSKMLKNMISE